MNYNFVISEKEVGKRLDVCLASFLDISRSELQKYINEECIVVNNNIVTKNGFKLTIGEKVEVNISDDSLQKEFVLEAEEMDLNIVYEDEFLMILNKKPGMLVHPGAGVFNGTIANGVKYYLGKKSENLDSVRPGIVHRLDKETSGLLIVAKDKKTHEKMTNIFSERKIEKKYYTLVKGVDILKSGGVDSPIVRNPKNRLKMMVSNKPTAKHALTHFDVLWKNEEVSFLDVHIFTGRTHQIRVHMEAIGYPVVGDNLYGDRKINQKFKEEYGLTRQFLHAYSLKFTHPMLDKEMDIQIGLLDDLEKIAEMIELNF